MNPTTTTTDDVVSRISHQLQVFNLELIIYLGLIALILIILIGVTKARTSGLG